jgi:large subunit ribosomal protein L15
MNIDGANRGIQKHKNRKRIGRGVGSGHGKTAGRGHKGQGSRAGWNSPATFEGGQMPLFRRVPKRGFFNKFALTVAAVNVGDLEDAFEAGAEVTPQALQEKGIVKRVFDVLKILGDGPLTKRLVVSAHRFSRTATEKIQQAGGETRTLPGKKPVVKNKQKSAQKTV